MSYYDASMNPLIEKLVLEAATEMPDIHGDLEKNFKAAGGWTGFLAGAGAGAMAGAHIGIAAGPLGAMAGTLPGAIVGGAMGFFGGQEVGLRIEDDPPVSSGAENLGRVTRSCPSCNQKLRLALGNDGQVNCPSCANVFRITT
jgi:phage tail tape-measure protein